MSKSIFQTSPQQLNENNQGQNQSQFRTPTMENLTKLKEMARGMESASSPDMARAAFFNAARGKGMSDNDISVFLQNVKNLVN